VPREAGAGTVTSRPVRVDRDRRLLQFVSWDERAFDPAKGDLAVCVRTADEKVDLDRAEWTPVANQKRLDLELGDYLQWKVEMTSRELYRPPGAGDFVFAFARTASEAAALAERPPSRWPWLLAAIPLAAAVVWLLVGRKSLWMKKRR
jgi:hypothetical protein